MKKIFILSCFLIVLVFNTHPVSAADYLAYQTMSFEKGRHKLLHQYSDFEVDQMMRQLDGRRFFGWRTHTEVRHQKVTYLKETMMVIENGGLTTIEKSFFIKQTEQARIQLNTSGTIRLKGEGKIKTFDMGLDTTLNVSRSSDTTYFFEERTDIRIKVDPQTRVSVEIHGEGYVSNGVGSYYAFWRNIRRGGWEVFTVSTEFYSIVKEPL